MTDIEHRHEGELDEAPVHDDPVPETNTPTEQQELHRSPRPEADPAAAEPAESRRLSKPVRIIGGAVLVGAAFVGGLLARGGGDDSSKQEAVAESPGEGGTATTLEEAAQSFSQFDISRPRQGEEFFAVTRADGLRIEVPKFTASDINNPQEYGRKAMYMLAAFWTTHDDRILDEFTSDEEVRALLKRVDSQLTKPEVRDDSTYASSQIVIFEGEDNSIPVRFESIQSGFLHITLSQGEMTLRPYFSYEQEKNQWQDQNAPHAVTGISYKLDQLDITVDESTGKAIGLSINLRAEDPALIDN